MALWGRKIRKGCQNPSGCSSMHGTQLDKKWMNWISVPHHFGLENLWQAQTCCPAAIPSRTLTVRPAVIAACGHQMAAKYINSIYLWLSKGESDVPQTWQLPLQIKSVSSQRLLGSADQGNLLHIDLFESLKNWVTSLFHPTRGTYLRKQNKSIFLQTRLYLSR